MRVVTLSMLLLMAVLAAGCSGSEPVPTAQTARGNRVPTRDSAPKAPGGR